MRTGGFRWWFEHRTTGEITIVQFPNWPIWCIAATWIVRLVLPDGSTADDALGWVLRGLWLFWGVDEIVRGVNPWRRLLGTAMVVAQIVAITID